MKIEQTAYFKDDANHYTKLATEYQHTTRRDDIRRSLYKLERLRGREYVDKLASKCNQRAKARFYYREEV